MRKVELRSRLAEAGVPVTSKVRQTLVDAITKFGPAKYAEAGSDLPETGKETGFNSCKAPSAQRANAKLSER